MPASLPHRPSQAQRKVERLAWTKWGRMCSSRSNSNLRLDLSLIATNCLPWGSRLALGANNSTLIYRTMTHPFSMPLWFERASHWPWQTSRLAQWNWRPRRQPEWYLHRKSYCQFPSKDWLVKLARPNANFGLTLVMLFPLQILILTALNGCRNTKMLQGVLGFWVTKFNFVYKIRLPAI